MVSLAADSRWAGPPVLGWGAASGPGRAARAPQAHTRPSAPRFGGSRGRVWRGTLNAEAPRARSGRDRRWPPGSAASPRHPPCRTPRGLHRAPAPGGPGRGAGTRRINNAVSGLRSPSRRTGTRSPHTRHTYGNRLWPHGPEPGRADALACRRHPFLRLRPRSFRWCTGRRRTQEHNSAPNPPPGLQRAVGEGRSRSRPCCPQECCGPSVGWGRLGEPRHPAPPKSRLPEVSVHAENAAHCAPHQEAARTPCGRSRWEMDRAAGAQGPLGGSRATAGLQRPSGADGGTLAGDTGGAWPGR